MRKTLIIGVCLLMAAPAWAVSSHLWSERPAGSAPLAQVPDFRALAAQAIPAVVSIQVDQRVRMQANGQGGQGDFGGQDPREFFHRYFGGEMPREFRNRGLGSGFVVDASGIILTNYHVVENADSIEVTLTQRDGSEQKVNAKVLGAAPRYDVAVLKTEEKLNAPVAYLGDSDSTQIGDWVMAVGNPFGLSHSVSTGIISAKERRDVLPSGRQGLYNFLQTDASINPGNSGGPLINMRGEVIGINSAINASGSGIGFAIPINMVKEMLPDLTTKGRYARSWIGIRIQPLTPELAQTFGLKRPVGALVAQVVPNGPAAEANIKEGDVVLQFDGKDLRNASDLPLFASMAGVGKTVTLNVWRDGREMAVKVHLTEYPDEPSEVAAETSGGAGALGMSIGDLTPALRRDLGLEQATGVVVRSIEPGGAADRAGLRPGDLLLSINGQEAKSARTVAEVVQKTKSGALLRLKVSRSGSGLFTALKKP